MISPSRREFLYKGFSALALLSMPLPVLVRYAKTLKVEPVSLKALAEGFQGTLVLPGNSDYDKYRLVFNRRYDFHPMVIALCRHEDDVAHCVKWAVREQIPIRMKSGGHSYENLSSGTGIVIDLREMNQIQVNQQQRSAEIQPGAKLEKVYSDLWKVGLALPGGSCPTVGIGGLTLGGGQGYLLRSQGLASDHLSSVRVVNAEGDLVIANSDSNADLLWACQGAGAGSFGVVTSLGFDRLLPVDRVTLFQISWFREKVVNGFLNWQEWAVDTSSLVSSVWGKGAFENAAHCTGQFLGEPDDLRELIKPILKGAEARVWQTTFIDAVKFLGASDGTLTPVFFKTKSDYVAYKLDQKSISHFLGELARMPPESDGWVYFESYGGIMNDIPSDSTAFPHRMGNLYCVETNISWPRSDQSTQMLDWMREFHQKVRSYFSGAAYANYSDLDLDDWGHAYFGKNFERLRQIKKKYDLRNAFRFSQSIPPETEDKQIRD